MKNFLKKQRNAVAIVLYMALIAGVVYFIIMPLLSRINKVQDKIQEEKINQELKDQRINDLPKMQSQYENLQSNKSTLNILFEEKNAVELIEKLEKLSQETGNNIKISAKEKINPQKELPKSNEKKKAEEMTLADGLPSSDYLQMDLELYGEYNAAINFISKLENFEYYCDIIGIKMIQESESGNNKYANKDSFGVVNASPENEIQNLPEATNTKKIITNLEVVFYTKK